MRCSVAKERMTAGQRPSDPSEGRCAFFADEEVLMRRGFGLLFTLAQLAAMGCRDTAPTGKFGPLDYESNAPSEKYDLRDVEEVVDQFMRDYPSVEGVTLAIVRGKEGQIYESGHGAFARDRVSLIASTGKVLSVGIIPGRVDERLLGLDRPIAEFLN